MTGLTGPGHLDLIHRMGKLLSGGFFLVWFAYLGTLKWSGLLKLWCLSK